jgi:crotonobetainyl-CoA:carnitine CoA-transferase CaiB-like acyl-CoA transferase
MCPVQSVTHVSSRSLPFIIENFRPGTMEKWGLGYEDLKKENPGIIMIRVSGYGQTGPYSKRPGYASVGEAMGGVRYLMGEPDRKPSRAGISLGDTLAGTFAALGALAALHHREKTGEGQVVDAAIYESILAISESLVPEYTVEHYTRERSGSFLPAIAPSNIYDGSDGMVIIAANQDTIFARLSEAMGCPELKDDPRYATHIARGQNQAELDALINDWTKTRTIDEIEAIMIAHAVPVGKSTGLATCWRIRIMLPAKRWSILRASAGGTIKMQNVFPKLSATPGRCAGAGPETLGEHTEQVLTELLDLTPEQIEKTARQRDRLTAGPAGRDRGHSWSVIVHYSPVWSGMIRFWSSPGPVWWGADLWLHDTVVLITCL